MASTLFLQGISDIATGDVDWLNDTIKAAFMDPGYTVDVDAHDYYDDISANIASGSTDQTLASKAINEDVANTRIEFDAADLSISNETIVGGTDGIIIYKDTGTPGTSALIAWIEFTEGTLAPVNGLLTVTFDSNGLFAINLA